MSVTNKLKEFNLFFTTYERPFHQGISDALWNMNDEQVQSLIAGIEKSRNVLLVQIEDNLGKIAFQQPKKIKKEKEKTRVSSLI
mgnify:CR=1 FL=1